MSTTLGITLACRTQLDPSFRVCETDADMVIDETWRRMTTTSVLGDTPEAQNFGRNVFLDLGMPTDAASLALLGPSYSLMLQGSPLIETADVTVTHAPESTPSNVALLYAVDVTPINPTTGDVGTPLSFVFRLTADKFQLVGDPDGGA